MMVKLSACLAGFGLACVALIVTATILAPITGQCFEWLGVPGFVRMVVIVSEFLVLPVLGAIWGAVMISKSLASQRAVISE